MNKIISIDKRFATEAEEIAYQKGREDEFIEGHARLMRLVYVVLSKRKDRSMVVMDEELRAVPDGARIEVEPMSKGKRWYIP